MAQRSKNVRIRDAKGRFRSQRDAVEHLTGQSGAGNPVEHRTGVGNIALLSVALVVGAAGLAFHLFWIGALILMGILWGSLASEWQRESKSQKGVVAEVVDVVVEQARDIADSASATPSEHRRDP
jgi:Flp pilus assembly protein TadB